MNQKERDKKDLAKALKKVLRDIELGRIPVNPQVTAPMNKVASGVVEFRTDDGWRLFVFIDCGSWDYFDLIITPQKKKLTHSCIDRLIGTYRPSARLAKQRYGVAGYLKFDEDCVHFPNHAQS